MSATIIKLRFILTRPLLLATTLVMCGLIVGYFSLHHAWTEDLTQNLRNSLSAESQKTLSKMADKVEIIALAGNSPDKGKYFRKSITLFIERYKQYNENVILSFIDPVNDAKEAMALGLKQEGEWLVRYQNRQLFFKLPYTEERFTNLLLQLNASKKHSFFFTGNHHEPKLIDATKSGWSQFATVMQNNGIEFTQSNSLSDLTSQHILVINAPSKPFTFSELNQIQRHVNNGGNLIWLTDHDSLQGLEQLANDLNIEISRGIALDLSNQGYGLSPEIVHASSYANHEIFADYSVRTIFPSAYRISEKNTRSSNWKLTELIGVAENGWLTKKTPSVFTSEEISKNIDRQGPINIAIALERKFNQQQQRLVIIGESQFLSNSFISQGGNSKLGQNMFLWVSSSFSPVSLKPNLVKDSIVIFSNEPNQRYLIWIIFNGFQFGLPAMLLFFATFIWHRNLKM